MNRGEPCWSGTLAGCEHGTGWHDGALPFIASAPVSSRAWLLVEHPGPWPHCPAEAAFPPVLRPAVTAAADLGIRIQLIRRPGRRRPELPARGLEDGTRASHDCQDPAAPRPRAVDHQGTSSRVLLGWSAGPRPWLRRHTLTEPDAAGQLDLAGLARGRPPESGEPVAGPLLLICTHGRRNVCCARLGRPIAAALALRHGQAVWETTHVGGDRHAANLVILPHGLYYGPVAPGSAEAAIRAYSRGEIVLDRFRGRAGQSERAQAAEHAIRSRTGSRGIDDLLACEARR